MTTDSVQSPLPPWTEEDMGKAYEITVNVDEVPNGEPYNFYFLGTFNNGGTYPIPPEVVESTERSIRVPLSEMYVPASCVLTVVEE